MNEKNNKKSDIIVFRASRVIPALLVLFFALITISILQSIKEITSSQREKFAESRVNSHEQLTKKIIEAVGSRVQIIANNATKDINKSFDHDDVYGLLKYHISSVSPEHLTGVLLVDTSFGELIGAASTRDELQNKNDVYNFASQVGPISDILEKIKRGEHKKESFYGKIHYFCDSKDACGLYVPYKINGARSNTISIFFINNKEVFANFYGIRAEYGIVFRSVEESYQIRIFDIPSIKKNDRFKDILHGAHTLDPSLVNKLYKTIKIKNEYFTVWNHASRASPESKEYIVYSLLLDDTELMLTAESLRLKYGLVITFLFIMMIAAFFVKGFYASKGLSLIEGMARNINLKDNVEMGLKIPRWFKSLKEFNDLSDILESVNRRISIETNKTLEAVKELSLQRKNEKARYLEEAKKRRIHPVTLLPNKIQLIEDCDFLSTRIANNESIEFNYLVILDINNFKRVNDLLGEIHGNTFCFEVGQKLLSIDDVSRVYSLMTDVYVVFFSKKYKSVNNVQNSINKTFKKTILIDGVSLQCAFNGGAIDINSIDFNIPHWQEKFKNDMYFVLSEAKNKRLTNHLTVMDDTMIERRDLRNYIESNFAEALIYNYLYLVFQPKIDAATGECTGAEALIRWCNPDGVSLCPDQFIPYIKKTSRMIDLTYWICKMACKAVSHAAEEGFDLPISINVSPEILPSKCFADKISKICRNELVAPEMITIEITEDDDLLESKETLEAINTLAKRGHKISIDDFGTGHSSLERVTVIPFQEIKIDKFFITPITDQNLEIIKFVVALVKQRGGKVVVEGVEEQHQVDRLIGTGVDIWQGYFFDKPLDINTLINKYHKN